VQLHARIDVLGEEAFARLTSLDLGDLVGIDGASCAAAAASCRCASTAFRSSPRRCVRRLTSTTADDVETRYRRRELD